MRVLVACEFSGIVRDAFRARGHDAWSCDFEPCESDPQWHVQTDVRPLLVKMQWDLIIAHPPCTRASNAGLGWLLNRELWTDLDLAAEFFLLCEHANASRVVVENPIPHSHFIERIGRKYDQIIHPWQFGHREEKTTCLWLRGVEKLIPTDIVGPPKTRLERALFARLANLGETTDRWKERSRTYSGIANAMAEQWG